MEETDVQSPEPLGAKSPKDSQLCGWLKVAAKVGLVTIFKKRWLIFDDARCKLFIYRNPNDRQSLGDVDISNACFNYKIDPTVHCGLFEIKAKGELWQFQAPDENGRMYWLQELQRRRRAFSFRKTSSATSNSFRAPRSREDAPHTGGLAESEEDVTLELSDQFQGLNFPVIPPAGQVGKEAADQCRHTRVPSLGKTIANQLRETLNIKKKLRSHLSSGEYEIADDAAESPLIQFDEEVIQPKTLTTPSSKDKSNAFRVFFKRNISAGEVEISSPILAPKNACPNCNQLSVFVKSQQEELEVLERELDSCKKANKVLQRKLDTFAASKRSSEIWSGCITEDERLELLRNKDQSLTEREHLLQERNLEITALHSKISDLENEVTSLQDDLSVFQEYKDAKDKVVIELSNRLIELSEELEAQNSQKWKIEGKSQFYPVEQPEVFGGAGNPILEEEMERLKFTLSAYENQNQFLNKEVLELIQLRDDDSSREQHLIANASEWEAKYFQILSKYLILMNEMHIPTFGTEQEKSQELVTRLLKDAIECADNLGEHPGHLDLTSVPKEKYDEYGFAHNPNPVADKDEFADMKSRAETAMRKHNELLSGLKDREKITVQVKWENYMVGLVNRQPVGRSEKLKSLIRMGVPHSYRKHIWSWCIDSVVGTKKRGLGNEYYSKLLAAKNCCSKLNPAVKQIEMDLLRTLPANKHYEMVSSAGIPKLRRVLQVFSLHNPIIGYCQGLNRLAAIALLFLNEEESFWCLVAIVEHIMPSMYYSSALIAAQVDQRVLKELIAEKLPRLHQHLSCYEELDLSLFTFSWFLCIFVDDTVPVELYLRIWDTFLYEGSKVLFRFALALLKCNEATILKLNNQMKIYEYLQNMHDSVTDVDKIVQMAFNDFNPFSRKYIKAKRESLLVAIKSELQQLEKFREEARNSEIPDEQRDAWCMDDES